MSNSLQIKVDMTIQIACISPQVACNLLWGDWSPHRSPRIAYLKKNIKMLPVVWFSKFEILNWSTQKVTNNQTNMNLFFPCTVVNCYVVKWTVQIHKQDFIKCTLLLHCAVSQWGLNPTAPLEWDTLNTELFGSNFLLQGVHKRRTQSKCLLHS